MHPVNPKLPAVFLDRDGTLMEEVCYCRDPDLVSVFEGVGESLMAIKAAGFLTILVTNQSGIAKGVISPADYASVHERLLQLLPENCLDDSFMCPDASEAPSPRRKPAPGMLLEAAEQWNIDLRRSWIIGDKDIDIACGVNAGVPGILVRTGHGRLALGDGARHVAESFREATAWLLSHHIEVHLKADTERLPQKQATPE
jgi:D-glycero-D-manno-heptose 1,7-bisphosphate phosphatase